MGVCGNVLLGSACLVAASLAAQSPADWQTAAGGKAEFEVASVKPTKIPKNPNFPLNNMNAKTPGGRFSAGLDLQASSAQTQAKLGWKPTGPGLIADLENMQYSHA